ncbi:MAG: hypothetical protein J4215_00475 [Candidatus Diapherotrites archaeon]|uniref:Uncharacterized protein n=1 Tax=Candidatus Iainarchaeum sp. TaxID=3101447 RepID=A0A8T4L3A9_9ARCH|nr:hypothetical protein [Candidatus Diapherotrites archaeon]
MKPSLLLFATLLFASVFAATIQTDKNSFFNNETIKITGVSDQSTTLFATLNGKIIFERPVSPGNYAVTYPIDYLDPVGDWVIALENASPSIITVRPTSESATLILTFTSPSPGRYKRTQTISFSVQVTKNNQPVSAATVAVWDPNGNRMVLNEKENGNYRLDYMIPENAPLGRWGILATARASTRQGEFGGTAPHTLEIEAASIMILPTQPLFPNYNVGDTLEIEIAPKYPDQKPVQNPRINATLGGQSIELKTQTANTYAAKILLGVEHAGTQAIEITVVDDYNNTGTLSQSILVAGQNQFLISQYGAIVFVIAILFLIALHFVLSSKKQQNKRNALLEEKKQLQKQQASLEQKYFKEQSIDETIFERQSNYISRKKASIEQQITQLKNEKKKE